MLKGVILKILSPSRVLINLGRLNGVGKNMRFVIYEEGEMIKDPVSGEEIEKLELVKGEVEVIHVQEKISIAESFMIEKRTIHSPFPIMSPPVKEEVKITHALTKEPVPVTTPSPLKVGDLVRQI